MTGPTALLASGCSSTTATTTVTGPPITPEVTRSAAPTASESPTKASPSPKPPKASNAVTVDSAVAKMSASERKAFCKKVTSTPTQVIADLKRWTGKGAGGAISEAYSVCTSYGL